MAEYYRAAIRAGQYEADPEFPTVREIAEAWKVSPNTVRRALAALREEGWIDYSQGRRVAVIGVPGRH